jgi:hypothetical protein
MVTAAGFNPVQEFLDVNCRVDIVPPFGDDFEDLNCKVEW